MSSERLTNAETRKSSLSYQIMKRSKQRGRLNFASGLLQDFLKTIPHEDKQTEIPLPNFDNAACIHLLNAFIEHLDKKNHDELRAHYDNQTFWLRKLVRLAL